MTKWLEFTGSAEQMIAMNMAKHGYLLRLSDGSEPHLSRHFKDELSTLGSLATHYLICEPHPLADMIIRQAQTGQPVWIKVFGFLNLPAESFLRHLYDGMYSYGVTATPDWNIPNAEYSFTTFKEVEK